jgi:hypothetical protein
MELSWYGVTRIVRAVRGLYVCASVERILLMICLDLDAVLV